MNKRFHGDKKLRFEAHRGVGTEYPENTLPAFEAAVKEGYDVIELDLKFTADNKCVILHDRTLARTARRTDGSPAPNKSIGETAYDELAVFDFGSWKAEKFAGTGIPQLRDALEFAAKNDVALKLDNVFESFTPEQKEIFYSEIEAFGLGNRVGFTCSRPENILYIADRFPEAELHYDGNASEEILRELSQAVKERLTIWIPYPNRITEWVKVPRATAEYCAAVKRYGSLGIWLLTKPEELEEAALVFGADIIETDGSLKPDSRYF